MGRRWSSFAFAGGEEGVGSGRGEGRGNGRDGICRSVLSGLSDAPFSSRSRVGGRSGLFVPVWITHMLAPGTKSSAAFHERTMRLGV